MSRPRPIRGPGARSARIGLLLMLLPSMSIVCAAGSASAQSRLEELEDLRGAIQDSRGRVTAHEADERAVLEQLEEVDRRLQSVSRERDVARREVALARRRLAEVEPELALARVELASTQHALATRASALYRGGEIGPLRVIFSSSSLPELLARANALRVLVRHDAKLVTRYGEERDRLAQLQEAASRAVLDRATADANMTRVVAQLRVERENKGELLARLRQDRTSERRLLLELEQAAQALEETIRTLGARAESSDAGVPESGFAGRRGRLAPPVNAAISEPFGRVVDSEFQTETFRSGVDFGAEAGAPVRSVANGIVRFAGWFRGYGRIVIVDHGDAFHTISGHLDEIQVEVGNPVVEGQVLGTVGETGSLGGPSLYFELRRGGEPVDPASWLLDARG